MHGDFSKDSFHRENRFHDVLLQQGRVMLDAEWNEQASISAYRTETGVRDIVGKSGTPFDETNPSGGFQILPANSGADLVITKGHYYVDGILCENDSEVSYANQPDLKYLGLPANPDGEYLFYLDVWQRHITVLENPSIREVALGGPDTTTRTKTIWQIKWKGPAVVNCANALDDQITAAPTGKLSAKSSAPESTTDPCGLAESGGYTRLENQLYRVEIHIGGSSRANSTFKWSRDNGIVIAKWESQDNIDKNRLNVNTIGRDAILSFKQGDWIEIIDDKTDLLGKPGILAELLTVESNTLIIKPSTIKDPDNPGATSVSIAGRDNPRIRRWDSAGDLKLAGTWTLLEDGVEVKFDEGTFRTGDYWQIPARTAIADIEWPFLQSRLPFGIKHHFALLGILKLTAGTWSVVSDCRALFPPLTGLTSLFYVSGDGQEAMPGNVLPKPIVTGVSNGQWPVKNAKVKFTLVTAGVGSLVPADGIVFTDNEGLASCSWTLGIIGAPTTQQVRAELLDAAGNRTHLPVIFTANQSIASNVFYDSNDCDSWGNDPHNTVAEAINSLCKRKSGKRGCTFTVGKGGDFETLMEALFKLEKLGEHVCLCLLPDDVHRINKSINAGEKGTQTLKISGCNALIEMDEVRVGLFAGKIILQGLNIKSQTKEQNAQILLNARETVISNCVFSRDSVNAGKKPVPFVVVAPSPHDKNRVGIIRGSQNKITCRAGSGDKRFTDDALAISVGISGEIENNEIEGVVRLQYEEGAPFLRWNSTQRDEILNLLAVNKIEGSGNLTIRANSFENVFTLVPDSGNQSFVIYKNLIITDNIFRRSPLQWPLSDLRAVPNSSLFVGELINLCNNQFLDIKVEDQTLCYIAGEAGMIIGNIGPNDDRALIETKFHRSKTEPTLIRIT